MQDKQRSTVNLDSLVQTIRGFADLVHEGPIKPSSNKIAEVQELLGIIEQVFAFNFPDFPENGSSLEESVDEEILPIDDDTRYRLLDNGILVDEDGYIEIFGDVEVTVNDLGFKFSALLSKTLHSLHTHIIAQDFFSVKDSRRIPNTKRTLIASTGAEWQSDFNEMLMYLYKNIALVDDKGVPIKRFVALARVVNAIFTTDDSLFSKWYGTDPAPKRFRDTAASTVKANFSGWRALQMQYPSARVEQASNELDLAGVDYVVYVNDKPYCYVQCKAKRENKEREEDIIENEFFRWKIENEVSSDIDVEAATLEKARLRNYIKNSYAPKEDYGDDSHRVKMLESIERIESRARKDGVPTCAYIFAHPSFYSIN